MEPERVVDEVVCLRERRVVKVSPDGERTISCADHCPLEACSHRVRRSDEPDALDRDSLMRHRFGLQFCGELVTPLVTALDAELSVNEALAVLDAARVSSAPVVDDNMVLVGQVSSVELHAAEAKSDLEVEDAMSTAVVAVSARATVPEIAQVMDEHDLDRVPVVNDEGQLLGLVTAIDLVRWFRRHALAE